MTKEELKQEAEEWLCNNLHSASEEDFIKAMVDIAEPREKRIAELEKKNAILEKRCANYKEEMEKNLADAVKLEKENAEFLCQKNRNKSCYSCVNATERCFRNEIGCPCQKYKSYKEENAELKKTVEHYRKEREFFISEVEK